ncbi:unnamed protein product [Clonostachys byssicola]|uniref:Uncharacterized protein n=1 Tax=Clonostachys byssicola TaxID=160290 RepID=A0A9N9U637_9HYPO|nr:unnamed protein product [Clonostachys byssicola]
MEANTKRHRLPLHRVLLLGSGGVGKTSLCNSFCLGHFVDTFDSSIDNGYRKEIAVDDKPCVIHIFDKGGQAEHLTLRQEWIRENTAFILVFSFLSRESFEKTKKLYQQIQSIKNAPFPLILAGNKSDIKPELWEISSEEARSLATDFDCEIMQTSARYDENVEEMFHKLIAIAFNLEERNREHANDSQNHPNAQLSIDDKGSHGDGARDDNTKDTSGDTSERIFETNSSTIINHTNLLRHTDHATERVDDSMPRSNYRERTGWRHRFSNFLRHL